MTSRKVMLDTCVFNALADDNNLRETFIAYSGNHDYLISSVQTDEIAVTPDSKKDRRQRLLLVLADIRARVVNTSVFVLGRSRLGRSTLGDGAVFRAIASYPKVGTKDAMIADTAVSESALLVTKDRYLLEAMIAEGHDAIDLYEYVNVLCQSVDHSSDSDAVSNGGFANDC